MVKPPAPRKRQRPRTSIGTWVVLGLLVVLTTGGIAYGSLMLLKKYFFSSSFERVRKPQLEFIQPSDRVMIQPTPEMTSSPLNTNNDPPGRRLSVQLKQSPDNIFLTSAEVQARELFSSAPQEMARPVRLTILGTHLYFLFRGHLYAVPLNALQDDRPLTPIDLMPPGLRLRSGERIRELVDIAPSTDQQHLFLLDKSNDVYQYNLQRQSWQFILKAAPYTQQPDPHYVALEHWNNRLYLLDYARNQIWKKEMAAPNPVMFFSQDIPSWQLRPGAHNITEAIDLHVDGEIFVLTRDRKINRYQSERLFQQPMVDLDRIPSPFANIQRKISPRSLTGQGSLLYITDSANQRVIVVDKHSGRYLKQYVLLGAHAELGRLHDVAIHQNNLFVLAGNQLVVVPLSGQQPTAINQGEIADNQLAFLSERGSFAQPVPGALFPDNAGIYPGARRLYRYGIHEGADFFDRFNPQGGGKYVRYGSSVAAIQDGVIKRADLHFREMNPSELGHVLAQCQAEHETNRRNEDRFRGRQVWIEHADGVVSVYAHLSGIAPGIQPGAQVRRGQTIGQVGNSGTSGGVHGNQSNPHLHLEIWLHDIDDPIKGEYLGKWLSLAETRELWEKAFAVK